MLRAFVVRRDGGALSAFAVRGLGVLLLVFAVLVLAGCAEETSSRESSTSYAPTELRVAVAANFAEAFDELGARFAASEGGVPVSASVGSTGSLAAQIVAGAPFDVLLAADATRPALLEEQGHIVPGSRFTYARGRLALTGALLSEVPDGPTALRDARVRHVALANPATAPYGEAARTALAQLSLDVLLAPKLVLGNDVGQAMQFVDAGAAELGFVALSQLAVRADLPRWIVPETLHDPILQDAALVRESEAARRLLAFLRSSEAGEVLMRFGYGASE